jgi:NADPH-dependent glutamate synthase beta subunit-like oxidoreductase
MGKVVKKKKKGIRGGMSRPSVGAKESTERPYFVERTPPCIHNCPNSNPIRKILVNIAQAEKNEISYDDVFEEAFHLITDKNPFPSVCGRVCPHPCETECNRSSKEGPVAINKVERFIGDYGLEKKIKPKKLTDEKRSEKIAVVGSGPGGLSCAYHLARRGYPVTVYEAFPKPGGMLRYGIPEYRLPYDLLDEEIKRIEDMGVEIKFNTSVGNDISLDDLRKDNKAIFVALGAHKGYLLRVEGEDSPNVFTGTDFLRRVNTGEKIEVGSSVVVIGGGDTAIDAARMARRLGADVTILYRRTRKEMPAIEEEIVGAENENVKIHFLAAPTEIYKDGDKATGMKCQKMELGEPDSSGRRRPVPIEGDTFDLEFTTLIAAISQEPEFKGFESLIEGKDWIKVDANFKTKIENVYSGGDNINLGVAIDAIYHGRMAAFSIHEIITGEKVSVDDDTSLEIIKSDKMILSHYEDKKPVKIEEMDPGERIKHMTAEITKTISKDDAVEEAKRCMSCGYCFDCGTCWSFCQDNAIVKPLIAGEKYKFKLEFCTGCAKCAENCPCGYIEMQ